MPNTTLRKIGRRFIVLHMVEKSRKILVNWRKFRTITGSWGDLMARNHEIPSKLSRKFFRDLHPDHFRVKIKGIKAKTCIAWHETRIMPTKNLMGVYRHSLKYLERDSSRGFSLYLKGRAGGTSIAEGSISIG